MNLKEKSYQMSMMIDNYIRDKGFIHGSYLTGALLLASPWISDDISKPFADFINCLDQTQENLFDAFPLANQMVQKDMTEFVENFKDQGLVQAISDFFNSDELKGKTLIAWLNAMPAGAAGALTSLGIYKMLDLTSQTLRNYSFKR